MFDMPIDLFEWGTDHTALDSDDAAGGMLLHCSGLSRHHFVSHVSDQSDGPIVWVAPAWQDETVNVLGFGDGLGPNRICFVRPNRAEDILWAAEESLRSGAAPIVVLDLPSAPASSALRRLRLAIDTSPAHLPKPTCVILTPKAADASDFDATWTAIPDVDPVSDQSWTLAQQTGVKQKGPQPNHVTPTLRAA